MTSRSQRKIMSTTPNSSDTEVDIAQRLDLIGDDCARSILTSASIGPRTAKELTASTDSSAATVYRRINSLIDSGLLIETVRFDENGSHSTAYETAVEEVRIDITDSGFEVRIAKSD